MAELKQEIERIKRGIKNRRGWIRRQLSEPNLEITEETIDAVLRQLGSPTYLNGLVDIYRRGIRDAYNSPNYTPQTNETEQSA